MDLIDHSQEAGQHQSLCFKCDFSPVNPFKKDGLCTLCHFVDELLSIIPDDFEDDVSGETIVEKAVTKMAKVWENSKRLKEQCEREYTSSANIKGYLWTQEIRGIMGWLEEEDQG